MLAVLRHLGLDNYIGNENVPGVPVAKEGQLTKEIEAQTWRKWGENMHPNHLAMGYAEMIHISHGGEAAEGFERINI